jgi:hypothetical protein
MKQLISIETVPIKIEYVEKEPHRKHSRISAAQTAQLRISQNPERLTIQSNPISIPLQDSFEQSSVTNWENLSYTATAQYSNDGKLRMNVKFSNSDSDSGSYQFQQFHRGIDHIIDTLPKSGESALPLEDMRIDFDMSDLPGPSVSDQETSFLPPDLELKVVERPRVIIKYLGGPIYIPPSADPNYDPSDYPDQVFLGKAGLDVKA